MSEDQGKNGHSICRDVQGVLFDYMTRELGPARSDVVREHVRRCEQCRAELAEMQKTLDVLTLARKAPVAERLSPDRRKRMSRAVAHPVIDWICTHNAIVGILAAAMAIIVAFLAMRWAMDVEPPDNSDAVPIDLTPQPSATNASLERSLPSLQNGAK